MSTAIRLRACLAVVRGDRLLLVPHYETDAGPVQWVVPGGCIGFCEGLEAAAVREFEEETGLRARVSGLLDVSEVILPEHLYHSITIVFSGHIVGGEMRAEVHPKYGEKMPRWFSAIELPGISYHPASVVQKALGFIT